MKPSIKEQLYEQGITLSDVARSQGVPPMAAIKAVGRWQGKTGNPRGKTRDILKYIESLIGHPIYQEAGREDEQWNG